MCGLPLTSKYKEIFRQRAKQWWEFSCEWINNSRRPFVSGRLAFGRTSTLWSAWDIRELRRAFAFSRVGTAGAVSPLSCESVLL
jgi:hypothetical protein